MAASCASVGSATFTNFFEPKATSTNAAEKPLNGMFDLSSLSLVTAPFFIFAVSIALFAISPTTMVSSKILDEVTELSASLDVFIAPSATIAVSTFPVPIAVTPAFEIVTSPDGVTAVA